MNFLTRIIPISALDTFWEHQKGCSIDWSWSHCSWHWLEKWSGGNLILTTLYSAFQMRVYLITGNWYTASLAAWCLLEFDSGFAKMDYWKISWGTREMPVFNFAFMSCPSWVIYCLSMRSSSLGACRQTYCLSYFCMDAHWIYCILSIHVDICMQQFSWCIYMCAVYWSWCTTGRKCCPVDFGVGSNFRLDIDLYL